MKIEKLISKINDIIVENNIKGIVVGLPLNMDGSEGRSVQSVKDKMKLITEKINIPVVLWDERLSTLGSFNISSQLDINTSKKLKDIDKNSAAFILQGSLDYLNK